MTDWTETIRRLQRQVDQALRWRKALEVAHQPELRAAHIVMRYVDRLDPRRGEDEGLPN